MLYGLFFSSWEGLSIPHVGGVHANPINRSTTFDFQGLVDSEVEVLAIVQQLLDQRRAVIHESLDHTILKTSKATYFIVEQEGKPYGIYRIVPVEVNVPWSRQMAYDRELYQKLVDMNWTAPV